MTIRGTGFNPWIRISYIDSNDSVLDTEFITHLGETSLPDVSWVDEHTLTAVVPSTLGLGVYDLTVHLRRSLKEQ